MPNYRPERDRFFEKVEKQPSGCWTWIAAISKGTGYGVFKRGRTREHIGAHRWSYEFHKGPIPSGMLIDHACRNRSCVNPDHLRLATSKQNGENVSLSRINTTGYRGVYFCKRTKRYAAQVRSDGKLKFLGRYSTAEEAAEAARKARNEMYTHNVLDRI